MTISQATQRSLKQALIKAASADEVNQLLDSIPDQFTIDATVTLTNAVSANVPTQVPAGAVITSVAANLVTAVAGDDTGDNLLARVGIGIAGTVAKYGSITALTKNSKLSRIPTHAVLASAETIAIFALKSDNTAATEKFAAGGRVRVRITYSMPPTLPDA